MRIVDLISKNDGKVGQLNLCKPARDSRDETRLLFGIGPIESRAPAAVACGLLRFDCRPDSHPGGADGGGGGASVHGVLEVQLR